MTIKEMLTGKSSANYVEYGYGQVEPNHLSAQRTGQIYAQLPTASDIEQLENGQFVKYNYGHADGAQVDFEGAGEWMLVLNEIKLYRDEPDCAFAMKRGDYLHRIYSPSNGGTDTDAYSRYYGAKGYKEGSNKLYTETDTENDGKIVNNPIFGELDAEDNPFKIYGAYSPAAMTDKYAMVPRVLKTNIGDIFTTNTIKETALALGNELVVGQDGYLKKKPETGNTETMIWQVVKLTTMPDGQKGVKIMRIA